MAPIEISIPTTTVSDTPKPHTLYNITVRFPLRSLVVQRRYSEFIAFHDSLTAQIAAPPPATLPSKSWFTRTISNPHLLEERRKGLEEYLRAINDSEDSRWRNSSAWRTFLNLPATTARQHSSSANSLHAALTGPGGLSGDGTQVPPITDPTTWLDCHREVKSYLHDARLHLTRRDQASTPQKQHECSAQAKSNLVKVGRMLGALEEGLKNIQGEGGGRSGWGMGTGGASQLGSGELRRRKDLLASAHKEKDGLENLLNAMATKSKLDSAVATMQDKEKLIGHGPVGKPKPGRILGRETDQTRELDNEGVMQLQKQIMQNQDQSVEELRKIVTRQKELGIAINEELQIQKELLNQVDEDTDRMNRKVDIGRKRAFNIS